MSLFLIGATFIVALSLPVVNTVSIANATIPNPKLDIVFPYRRNLMNFNSSVSPCGNSTKGKAHGLASPSSYLTIGIKTEIVASTGNCTIRLGTGTDIDDSFMVLKPINIHMNSENTFECGRSNKSMEKFVTKLPEDFQCDNCTLQLIWDTDKGTFYECSDVVIYEKNSLSCAEKCQNNGICINGKCSCSESFIGEFCEVKKFGGSIFTWKLGLILLILALLCLVVWYIIYAIGLKIKINVENPSQHYQQNQNNPKGENISDVYSNAENAKGAIAEKPDIGDDIIQN